MTGFFFSQSALEISIWDFFKTFFLCCCCCFTIRRQSGQSATKMFYAILHIWVLFFYNLSPKSSVKISLIYHNRIFLYCRKTTGKITLI